MSQCTCWGKKTKEDEEKERKAKQAREDAAKKAKEEADKRAAKRIDDETERLRQRTSDFNPYTANGNPAAMRDQAKQARAAAAQLRAQEWNAFKEGNLWTKGALGSQALELENWASKLETASRNIDLKEEEAAREAKRKADKAAADKIDEDTGKLRQQNLGFNPYTATGDPAQMREQAKQAREAAEKRRAQSWDALKAGDFQQQWALGRQASELDSRASELETASRNMDLKQQAAAKKATDEAEEAKRKADQAAADKTDKSDQPWDQFYQQQYDEIDKATQEAIKSGLKGAVEGVVNPLNHVLGPASGAVGAGPRAKSLVPLVAPTVRLIEGIGKESLKHINASHDSPPPAPYGGSASSPGSRGSWSSTAPAPYGGSAAPPARRDSWNGAPPADSAPEDYEQTVNNAFQDLKDHARQKREAEHQRYNELLNSLRQPAPAAAPPPTVYRDRFDQPAVPTPSPSPTPNRHRFDQPAPTPTPPGESQDLRSRRSRFD